MTSRIERDFRTISVVDGLDLFEGELRTPSKETVLDSGEADVNEPAAKRAGARDRQKKKDG
jgi:hypothetical protein